MQGVKAIIKTKDWGDYNEILEFHDNKYEVYSYECGDGIWGFNLEFVDEYQDEVDKEIFKLFNKEIVKLLDECEESEVVVPFELIERKGYSIINKKGKVLKMSEKDMAHCCFNGCIDMPDGSCLEPDAEGSPLMEMGLI